MFIVLPWLPRGFANIIYSNCQVTVTLQLLKMTLESVETSSKSFIIIINFIVKSIRNNHLIRSKDIWIICCDRELATSKTPSHHRLTKSTSRILVSCWSSFPMSVERNYVTTIATLCDCLKDLAPVFEPMRSLKLKFWLVHRTLCSCCDWSE